MASIQCGAGIFYPNFEQGASGCLVRFTDRPTHALLLTAGHVVLPSNAKQGDPIYANDLPGVVLGTLRTWTNFQDSPTADAALIWVDPSLVDPSIIGLGTPTGFNLSPQIGDTLRILPAPGTAAPRETRIEQVGSVEMFMPGWQQTINYRDQLLCRPLITVSGDSGAIALDAQNKVVGLVVGGSSDTGQTLITPITAILNNSAWNGAQIELLTSIPSEAVAPPLPPAAPPATPGTVPTGPAAVSPQPIVGQPSPPQQVEQVPFATTSTNVRYWPILSTDSHGREITYIDINGQEHGSNQGRRFFADRDGGARHHVAVDLYGNAGDVIVAVEDGQIVHFYPFYNGVYALIVQCKADLVINYGEVDERSLARFGLQIGSQVRAGQPIAIVGQSTTGSMMCHFETYVTGTISNERWMSGQPAPLALLDPTAYLLELAGSGH